MTAPVSPVTAARPGIPRLADDYTAATARRRMAFLAEATGASPEHLANVAESSAALVHTEVLADGSYYYSITIPALRDLAVMGANLMDPRRRQDVLEVSLRTAADSLATLDRVASRAA